MSLLLGSRRSFRPARAGVLAVTAALLAAGAAVVTATPAGASGLASLTPSSWSYIDSAVPKASFVNPRGDAPVGAYRYADGTDHVSKSYFTYDLSSLRGAQVLTAYLSAKETTVADCSLPRSTELWVTAPVKNAPTWQNQPAELSKLPGPGDNEACPSEYVGWDAGQAVRDALAAGRSSLTLVLRLPEAQQNDPRHARTYQPSLFVSLDVNRAPDKPTDLTTDGKPCDGKPLVGPGETQLVAKVTDPDDFSVLLDTEFAFWPADHPDQRSTSAGRPYGGDTAMFDVGPQLADGVTYAWQVRGKDDLSAGPWSRICTFRTDLVQPDKPPTVTSTDFTSSRDIGGTGIPGTFTFGANGVKDVTGYVYGFNGETYIPVSAAKPGGPATVSYTPDQWGSRRLTVRSVDAAGSWSSERTTYEFFVPNNAPVTTCTPDRAYLGEPRQCTIRARGNGGATAFVYRFEGGPATTVPAGPDGTATITVTPADPAGSADLRVRTRLANGNLTVESTSSVNTDRAEPVIDVPRDAVVGKPASIAFHAVLPGSETFTYRFDSGEPITVPVGADGTTTVTVVPAAAFSRPIEVFSTTGTGQRSGTESTYVDVLSNQPAVTSTDYPEYAYSGGTTIPGTFTFSSPVPGAVSYTYTFNEDAPVTVPAGPDGTASVVLTPLHAYSQTVLVTTRFTDGAVSLERRYEFNANAVTPQASCDTTGFVRPGQEVHCTLTSPQPNVAGYRYRLDADPEVTVPAASDGRGAMSFTVPPDHGPNQIPLSLWSVNTAGQLSDELSTGFDMALGAGARAAVRAG
ncbi:MAG: hypothetical protein QOI78_8818 [Actinomycetota bacterium]|nr:hypothetical protein [Actinomycetota bacterium]